MIVLSVSMLSACKPTYKSPLESPAVTKAAEDADYKLDFEQMEEDIGVSIQDAKVYTFIKNYKLDGDNESKTINVTFDISENVSEDAIEVLLTEVSRLIVDEAHMQDFRIDNCTDDSFGNLFDLYSYNYKVTCNGEEIVNNFIDKGESLPFDPSLTIDNIIG